MGLFSIFKRSNTLYYPGDYTYFKHRDSFLVYQKIFSRLGIDFKIIDKNINSGIESLEAGYDSEARKLARRNFEIFKEQQITSIITNSPSSYKMFLYEYPEMLPDWNIEPKNVWRMILSKLENDPDLIKNKFDEIVTFQDSCYLGRHCEIYDEPRKIIKLMGYKINEMYNSKAESICSGSCGGLTRTNPELADKIAKEKLLQAKRTGAKKLIVCSFEEYDLIRKNSNESGIEVLELGEALGIALGITEKLQEAVENVSEDSEEEDSEEVLIETEANIKMEEEIEDDSEEDYEDSEEDE
ncbi:CoB--CoM heterodisulfide reductase iron-sulfur subunit D [uncultured archaeon]|nr:CoB--CoM heterodisulfide reductase iron-sulfur subunit D [uncultured archaeon]